MEEDKIPKILVELVRIRERNEITLPKKTREFLGVDVGDYIEFVQQSDGGVTAHKVIPQRVKNNANQNYQPPESGEERTIQGGNEHEQMAERTSTQSDSSGLDNAQGESHRADEKRVEDPTGKAGKIESRDGEDDPLS